ncbi:MAG TPA: hypothetical protein IAA95_06855 [Candidatus Aveggerthella excrementigallinarum]|nr:hypothetical protein [Candidatus Aveggerthella excrementigallinarum]
MSAHKNKPSDESKRGQHGATRARKLGNTQDEEHEHPREKGVFRQAADSERNQREQAGPQREGECQTARHAPSRYRYHQRRRERERGSARLQKDKYQNAKTRVRKQHFARVDHAPVHERDERRMVVGQLIRLTPFHEREELRDLARRVIVHIARSHRDQVRRPQHAYDQRHCDQRPKRVSGVKQGGKASRHDRAPRAGIALPFASGQAVRLARRLLPSQSTRQGNASGNEHREQEAPDGDQRKDEPHAKHQLHIGAIRPGDGNARCQNEGCDRIERKVFEATVNADARAASRANVSHGRPTPG